MKQLSEAEKIALIRRGKTLCVSCGCEMDAVGGGKTRKKHCSLKCKDRARRQRINWDARNMGAECLRIYLALPKGDAREQYVDWIMFLGTMDWRYAYMFRYRYSQARTVILEHFGEERDEEGRNALDRYLERPTVKRWRVPTASMGIKKKRSPYGWELHNKEQEFKQFVEAYEAGKLPVVE